MDGSFVPRRLAAVDMWGTRGTDRRRRIVVAEFLLGAVGDLVAGVAVLVAGGAWYLGGFFLGIAVNYTVLSRHALALNSRQRLVAELDGVDVPAQLKYYATRQLWVAVPAAVVVFDLLAWWN